VVTA
jgi:hypothetical protein